MTDTDARRKVIRTLEEAFAGHTGLVGEKSLLLRENEESALADSQYLHNGLFTRLLDSFFDLGLDAFSRKFIRADANEGALLISSFWTIRSAFNLFWDRYYSNSMGVLRTGLESVFLLTAERKGYIGKSRLLAIVNASGSASGQDRAQLKRRAQRLNAQVYRHLIGEQSGLSNRDQEAMQAFIDQLHRNVHYAFPAYARLMTQSSATGGMSIFPQFENGVVGGATVAFMATAWTYLHLLRLFLADKGIPDWFAKRFNVLDASFVHACSTIWSAKLQNAWQSFLKKHY
jgi:hypothetical protein